MLKLTIDFDTDCENPCVGWKVYSFLSKHSNHLNPVVITKKTKDKLKRNLAFPLDYYEHGDGIWSLAGSRQTDRWDTSRNAGIIIWEEDWKYAPRTYGERRISAAAMLDTYSDWANGHNYMFTLTTIDENGQEVSEDSVGGYIGYESVLAGIHDMLQGRTIDEVDGECADLWEGEVVTC